MRIRLATDASIPFVKHLQSRGYARDAGYLPPIALQKRIAWGQLLIATLNDQPAAHIVLAPRKDHILHVSQVVVSDEAWRAGIGSALMEEAYRIALRNQCDSMTVRCALDAYAHQFWPETSMTWHATSTSKRRLVACWSRPVGRQGLHRMPPPMRNQQAMLHHARACTDLSGLEFPSQITRG